MKSVFTKAVALLLLVVFCISLGTGCAKVPELPEGVVAKVGNYEITPADYMYMLCRSYYTYSSVMYSQMKYSGYDFSLTPDRQNAKYKEDTTWDQYFKDYALSYFIPIIRLYSAGKDAGFEVEQSVLDDYAKQMINEEKVLAKQSKLSLSNHLFAVYGPTTTRAVFEEIAKKIKYALAYSDYIHDSLELTDEEIEQYRQDNIKDFYEVDLRIKMYSYSNEDEFNRCRDEAYSFKDSVSTPEEFKAKYRETLPAGMTDDDDASLLTNQKVSDIGSDDAEEWFMDESRKTGDVGIFIGGGRILLVMFIDRRYIYDYATCKNAAIVEKTNSIVNGLADTYPIAEKDTELIDAIANIAYHGE